MAEVVKSRDFPNYWTYGKKGVDEISPLAGLNQVMHVCPEICTLTCILGVSYDKASLRNSLDFCWSDKS